jgi:MFS family permease
MGSVLAKDRVFARYEAAFMTYGIGWMITFALLPLLATDRLKLPYDTYAESWQVASQLAVVLVTPFAGLLIDRIGAVRLCVVSFAAYALWPTLLLLAGDSKGFAAASLVFGLCAGAVNTAWMLGPVALAPSPDRASQYVAIHATLVGLRGVVFQFAGVFLYTQTGSFTAPLTLAALGFLWASWQMRRLHLLMKASGHPMTR